MVPSEVSPQIPTLAKDYGTISLTLKTSDSGHLSGIGRLLAEFCGN